MQLSHIFNSISSVSQSFPDRKYYNFREVYTDPYVYMAQGFISCTLNWKIYKLITSTFGKAFLHFFSKSDREVYSGRW